MRRPAELVQSWAPVVPEIVYGDHATLPALQTATAEREEWIKQNTLWLCTDQFATGRGCGMRNVVKETAAIQTHWYVSPYSCTGGDYWKHGEVVLLCPCCGKRNRLYASPALAALKPNFKSVADEYKE